MENIRQVNLLAAAGKNEPGTVSYIFLAGDLNLAQRKVVSRDTGWAA